MYHITNKEEYIKRLHVMLGLAPVGVCDKGFLRAIRNFKEKNGLEADATVDYKTFSALKKQKRLGNEASFERRWNNPMFIEAFNRDLSILVQHYGLPVRRPYGKLITRDTRNAVAILRKIYCLEDKNYPDALFISIMQADLGSIYAIN